MSSSFDKRNSLKTPQYFDSMKNRPIHENLDTSFVNLSALIKYLRRRQFVGGIKIQLNGYNAEIKLLKDNQMSVNERDQISGRVSRGEEALQRLLIRAREPGGTINVYQLVKDTAEETVETESEVKTPKAKAVKEKMPVVEVTVVDPIPKPAEVSPFQNAKTNTPIPRIKKPVSKPAIAEALPAAEKKPATIPDFPFRLSNKVEGKAKQAEISNEDWQTLLKLTVEILLVIDKSLAQANLDFSAAFRKARTEIADDYPFLNPDTNKFDYSHGRVKMTEKVNEKIFVASISESVRRILNKLETNSKFQGVHEKTVYTLATLMNKRESLHDKFGITPQLKRAIGI